MIVEDNKYIREELKTMLNSSGYTSQILKYSNLILFDINIPYLNGEQLIKELRKVSDIPIIMLTNKVSEFDQVLSMNYGADDYITKPYNPTLLLLKIAAILKRVSKFSASLYYNNVEVQKLYK